MRAMAAIPPVWRLPAEDGTGLENEARSISTFTSHTHLIIFRLTFFAPLFGKENSVRLWAGHLEAPLHAEEGRQQPDGTAHPVSLEVFRRGSRSRSSRTTMLRLRQNVPYRAAQSSQWRQGIASNSAASRFATSPIPSIAAAPTRPLSSCVAADLMITSSYTRRRVSLSRLGPSTWQEGTRVADAAGVGTLVVITTPATTTPSGRRGARGGAGPAGDSAERPAARDRRP